jgi:hypothetical protein
VTGGGEPYVSVTQQILRILRSSSAKGVAKTKPRKFQFEMIYVAEAVTPDHGTLLKQPYAELDTGIFSKNEKERGLSSGLS